MPTVAMDRILLITSYSHWVENSYLERNSAALPAGDWFVNHES